MKQKTAAERIKSIRGEMSQAEFGKLLDSSQGAVSAWERDDPARSPSALIYLRLAALAKDPDDAVFFLGQAGLDVSSLTSVLGMLLKKGEVKMDETILAAAEDELSKREVDLTRREEVDKASGVLVPPFPEQPSAAQMPTLVMPSIFVPHKASAYYLVAPNDPFEVGPRGYSPGDFIFFDASQAGSGEILDKLLGEKLLVRVASGLIVGRPGFVSQAMESHLALFPVDINPAHTGHHHPLLAKIGASWKESYARRLQSMEPHHRALYNPDWSEPSECQVLGIVFGQLSAGTIELWKRKAQEKK